jgi:hypothetical protein
LRRTNFNSTELCELIKSCAEHGVSKLTLGELMIEFGKIPEPVYVPTLANVQANSEAEKVALLDAEVDVKEDQLSQMYIEDPANYERLLLQGDLKTSNPNEAVDGAEENITA